MKQRTTSCCLVYGDTNNNNNNNRSISLEQEQRNLHTAPTVAAPNRCTNCDAPSVNDICDACLRCRLCHASRRRLPAHCFDAHSILCQVCPTAKLILLFRRFIFHLFCSFLHSFSYVCLIPSVIHFLLFSTLMPTNKPSRYFSILLCLFLGM